MTRHPAASIEVPSAGETVLCPELRTGLAAHATTRGV